MSTDTEMNRMHTNVYVLATNASGEPELLHFVSYALGADDKLVELASSAWLPCEPDAETVSVDIELFCDPAVGRCDPVELTGDQYRDLESAGRLGDYLQLLATLQSESAEELLREVSPGALRP